MASLCCTIYVTRPLSPLEENSSGSGMSISRLKGPSDSTQSLRFCRIKKKREKNQTL